MTDSLDERLLDVLAAQVASQLQVHDVQALGQTCHQLRRLVQDDIPGSSWRRSAELSFPPGHPVFSVPEQHIPRELSRLAAVHEALNKGKVAALLELSIWQGTADEPCASSFNQAGDLLIEKRGDLLVMSRLTEEGSRISRQQLWSIAAPDAPHTWWHLACNFVFSPDDALVAVLYTPYDDSYAPHLNVEAEPQEEVWDRLFLLHVGTRTLHHVASTPEFHDIGDLLLMQEAQFSPNSELLLVPWIAYLENAASARIELYSCSNYQRLCLVTFAAFGPEVHRSAFSPNSRQFATAWPGQFHVHTVEGLLDKQQLVPGVMSLEPGQDQAQLIDWSACGSHLSYWSSGLEAIFVYETENYALLASIRIPTHCVTCSGMDFGLSALVHASWSRDRLAVAVLTLHDTQASRRQLDLVAMTRQATFDDIPNHPRGIEADMPAWCTGAWTCMSPDGCFAAVSGPGCRIAVYACHSPERVLYMEFAGPQFELLPVAVLQHVVQMDWVQDGSAIMVHCNAESYHLEAPTGRLRTDFHDWLMLIKFIA